MAEDDTPAHCDAASCVAGVAVGLAIGFIGFALVYLSIRRRREDSAMRTFGENWYEKGNG